MWEELAHSFAVPLDERPKTAFLPGGACVYRTGAPPFQVDYHATFSRYARDADVKTPEDADALKYYCYVGDGEIRLYKAHIVDRKRRRRGVWRRKKPPQCGYGAGMALSKRTGASCSAIRRGMKELLSGETTDDGRIRRSGAGRKTVEELYPDIIGLTKEILDDETYGAPEGGKWNRPKKRFLTVTSSLSLSGVRKKKNRLPENPANG